MKRILFLLFGAIFIFHLPAFADFTDVDENTLYNNAIQWTVRQGITSGYENGQWGPDDCVTRAQLLKMLLEYRFGQDFKVRSMALKETGVFLDVLSESWYYDYIQYARFLEVVQGYADQTFKPNTCVNRAEAIKMAVITLLPGEEIKSTQILYYDDKPIIDMEPGAWYSPYARRLFKERLTGTHHTQFVESDFFDGTGQNLVDVLPRAIYYFPSEEMSRKEVAEMLYLIDQVNLPYPNAQYQIVDEWEGVTLLKQRLIKVNEKGEEEVVIEDMIETFGSWFEVIRNHIQDSPYLILSNFEPKRQNNPSSLYRLNLLSLELESLAITNDIEGFHYYTLSPDGRYMAFISGYLNESDSTMYWVDLEQNTYRVLVKLAENESFKSAEGTFPLALHAEWIDSQTIKYGVHQKGSDSGDDFLEYRTVSFLD